MPNYGSIENQKVFHFQFVAFSGCGVCIGVGESVLLSDRGPLVPDVCIHGNRGRNRGRDWGMEDRLGDYGRMLPIRRSLYSKEYHIVSDSDPVNRMERVYRSTGL